MLSLMLCFLILVGLVPITAYAAATIDRADVLIGHPAHLANPETFAQVYGNCKVDTTYNNDNFKNGLRWREISTGKVMSENDTFVGGNLYELSVLLISNTGYAFSASATTVTINMDPVSLTVLDVNRAKATITLTAVNLYINRVTITDLDAPKAGNTPDFSATLQENTCNIYTTSVSSGIAWYDHDRQAYLSETDRFQSGHQYSVGVYVQAKPGYEFPQNALITINGGACTIGQNDGQMLKAVLKYPALEEAHTHTPSAWRTTGAYHYKACTTCGEFLEQEDHKGGKATCAEKGKCTVCGYEYIDVNEIHTPDTSKWSIRGNMYHYHACKLCGAHCDIGAHEPGAAGTPDAEVVCKDCGYIITPAKTHKHELTKVPKRDATCTEPGNVEYYTCNGCSDFFTDSDGKNKIIDTIIAPMGHKISDDWKYDKYNHWRTCTVCNELLAETQTAHQTENGKCTTCNYDGTVPENSPSVTGTTSAPSQPQDNNQAGIPWWVWPLIGFVFVGVGSFVGIMFFKKKRDEKGNG